MNRYLIPLILMLAVLAPSWSVAASPEEIRMQELQRQIEALEKEASQYRDGIASEREKAASLNREISILRGQIGQIEAQIKSTDKKIALTSTEIETVEGEIAHKEALQDRKRDTIGRMIAFLDGRDREDILAQVFKYERLSDIVQQVHSVAIVQSTMLDIVSDLEQIKEELAHQKTQLQEKTATLQELKDQANQRKLQLASVNNEKARVLRVTKGQEATYQKQLTQVEAKKAEFFKELRELELKIISGGLYVVHITATSVPKKGTKLFTWPETGYRLTQSYGYTTYSRRGAYGGAPHNGIDMAAGFGSEIKAIGAGKIVANGLNDGWGNWIAIQHENNMVSVYAHMSSLAPLRVGALVTQGQTIGYEGRTGNATGSHLHLSLYRDFFTYINEKKNQLYFNYFEGSLNPADYM